MTGLETTFYIMAIVFMSLSFLMLIGLLATVIVIRQKINTIHDAIERKLDIFSIIAEKGGALTAMAGTGALRKAKRAFKK
ncbi:hypothetical protein H7097_03475 [Aeromicrobium sp.]|nr:hypothetical protein [Candidatus Saccharibacteria bacterium]